MRPQSSGWKAFWVVAACCAFLTRSIAAWAGEPDAPGVLPPAQDESAQAFHEFSQVVVSTFEGRGQSWAALGLTGSAALLAALAVAWQPLSVAMGATSTWAAPAWTAWLVQGALLSVAAILGGVGAFLFLLPPGILEKLLKKATVSTEHKAPTPGAG